MSGFKFNPAMFDNVGALNRRATFRTYSVSRGSFGEEVLTWTDLATVWAHMAFETQGSAEKDKGSRVVAKTSATLYAYHRSDINEKMVVRILGKTWNILSILSDARQQYMQLELSYELT